MLPRRGYLETIFEGESDLAGQTKLEEIQESQKRIGGQVDMREGEKLTVQPQPYLLLQAQTHERLVWHSL